MGFGLTSLAGFDKLSLSGAGFTGHNTTSAQPELVEGLARTEVLDS
jgi:hypothetical protein